MEEELSIPTPEPIAEEAVAEEAPVAPEPAVDFTAREEALAKKERDLQRGFDEIARRERELTQPAPADVPEFDDATMKALDHVIAAKLAPVAQENYALKQSVADAALDRFASKSGTDADALRRFAAEQRLDFASVPSDQLEEAFKVASNYMVAQTFDAKTERERLKAEVLKELEAEGVRVDAVRPARAETSADSGDGYEDIAGADERYAFVMKELGKKH